MEDQFHSSNKNSYSSLSPSSWTSSSDSDSMSFGSSVSSWSCSDDEGLENNNDDSCSSSDLKDSLSNLDSLRNTLPSKKGLSLYFGGKSQSFASFAELSSVEELSKGENPHNDFYKSRRRKMKSKDKCHSLSSSLLKISSPSMISKDSFKVSKFGVKQRHGKTVSKQLPSL